MDPREIMQFVLGHHQEFLCLGAMGVFVGVFGFGFIKMMEPIEREDEVAFAKALAMGVVLDEDEQMRGRRAKLVTKPNDKPRLKTGK